MSHAQPESHPLPKTADTTRRFAGGVAWAVCLLALVSCGSVTEEQRLAISRVQVLSGEPAPNCQNLGSVTGSRDSDGPHGVRAKAVKLGANTVRMDSSGSAYAFYCPAAAVATPDLERAP